MPVIEGLEVDREPVTKSGTQPKNFVRLGPLNVPFDLRDQIEMMAAEEDRSISSTCILLIKRGLKYTEEMKAKIEA